MTDKMQEKELHKDDALERLLDMMDDPSKLTDEEFDRLLGDDATVGAMKEIADCKDAVRRESSHSKPDVEMEWNKFESKHSARRIPNKFLLGTAAGIAASLLFVFL